MTILQTLTEKGIEAARAGLDKQGAQRLDELLAKAETFVNGQPVPLREAGRSAIATLRQNREQLVHLGDEGLLAFLAHVGRGDRGQAERLLRLRAEGGPEELLAESERSTASVLIEKRRIEKIEEGIERTIKEIVPRVAQTVLPILLGAL